MTKKISVSPVFIIIVKGVGLDWCWLLVIAVVLLGDDLLHLGDKHLAPDHPLLPFERLVFVRIRQRLILQSL